MNLAWRKPLPLAVGAFLLTLAAGAHGQEFRALWVDAFHAGFRSSNEVTQLLADARAAHFNAVVVEVRKRGDAYYNSNFEPKGADVSPQTYDPLADLVARAHDTNNGPRVEVHAWIVTFPIWNNSNSNAAPANHPVRLHPDWLSQTDAGVIWSGDNYIFDPGHPGVQEYTFNVAMDIISRYDVDGLNFDYVRYFGNNWGYNPVAVARFNARFNRSGTPLKTDPDWLQWRRDQITSLVRKVYLSAIAVKPQVKISADTICFAPGVTSDAGWTNSANAYRSVLQDWRAWMAEGILDLNIPMAYFDQSGAYTADWTNWTAFIKDHRYNRHAIIGPGIYLNSLSNALLQMRHARGTTAGGNNADGVCGYSYAVPFDPAENPGRTRADFLNALTQPSAFDPNATPLFATRASPPVMPWKATPTRGHLRGFVRTAAHGAGLELAILSLTGPTNRTLTSDVTGFFGAVDLPPGDYTLTASWTDWPQQQTNLTVAAGAVVARDFELFPPAPTDLFNIAVTPGEKSAIVTWLSALPSTSRVEYGLTTNLGTLTRIVSQLMTHHSVLVAGLSPDTSYFFRVISTKGTNEWISEIRQFKTAGQIIIDNPNAAFNGSWTPGTGSLDKFGADYAYAGSTNGPANRWAYFTPTIATPGRYDVYVWYPQGANRSTNAPHTVVHQSGQLVVWINQTNGGGAWRLLATNLSFQTGTNGFVRITNNTGESNKVVMADAVRFVYRAGQDTPAPGTVPVWWANYYFSGNIDASLDQDGDLYPTWAEYIAGTDPTDPASHLSLAMDRTPDPQVGFAPWIPGRNYELEERLAPQIWEAKTNLPLSVQPDGRASLAISNATEASALFRLKVTLTP